VVNVRSVVRVLVPLLMVVAFCLKKWVTQSYHKESCDVKCRVSCSTKGESVCHHLLNYRCAIERVRKARPAGLRLLITLNDPHQQTMAIDVYLCLRPNLH
jgi:hypothetical protein